MSVHPGPYTAEDLDRIPDLPPHTELIDGNLIFVSPQALFHSLAKAAIFNALERAVPPQLFAVQEMTVKLDAKTRPEPDLMVVDGEAVISDRQTGFDAADALLVVEVISPESRSRDRKVKPGKYAAAGIPHFWLVDDADGTTVVEVWKLDRELGSYALVGRFDEFLEVEEPFPATLDLRKVGRRLR
jgi:Uma2 family endonuclease